MAGSSSTSHYDLDMTSYTNLAVLNEYRSPDAEEERTHVLHNLITKGRCDDDDVVVVADKGNRIHLVVSKEYRVRKILYHDDFEKFVERLREPHDFSVCLSYELVHRLAFDVDCVECKNVARKTTGAVVRCENKNQSKNYIFRTIIETIKRVLRIDAFEKIVVTAGSTHGFHVLFPDINVDRCMYKYLCHKIATRINASADKNDVSLALDEGCSTFVLPFGRNHTDRLLYAIGLDGKLRSTTEVSSDDACPISKEIFPFYSLKFTDVEDPDTTESCQRFSTLQSHAIRKLRTERRLPEMKIFFYQRDHFYVHDERSLREYKRDVTDTAVPWELIRANKIFAKWLYTGYAARSAKIYDADGDDDMKGATEKTETAAATVRRYKFSYFDRTNEAKTANEGFVDHQVVHVQNNFRVMKGSFVRLNSDGRETTARKYILLENFANVRDVIYENDIIPPDVWNAILREYFDSEIGENKFVIAVMRFITTNRAIFQGGETFTDDQKLHIMGQMIVSCLSYDFITGIINDVYGTYKKIVSKITDVSAKTPSEAAAATSIDDALFGDGVYDFTFRGPDVVDDSRFDKIKSTNYDAFAFCASLVYYYGDKMPDEILRYYLFYYNHVSEDTLNKILSEYVDCNTMISLMFQTACARYTKDEKITLTTPAEMFRTHKDFNQLWYEIEMDDDDEDNSGGDDDNNNNNDDGGETASFLSLAENSKQDEWHQNKKRKAMGGGGSGSATKSKRSKRKKGKKICSRELIKTLKKYFWRPFTINGIPYMYNGNEYESAQSTYKMICDALKCTQSTFQDIFNARKFEQRHGRNFLYNTNFYYSAIKAPAVLNVVLKIRETACGGINSLLHRSYLNSNVSNRSDLDVFDLVADALNAIGDIENDVDESSLRLLMTQPIVPPLLERDVKIREFLENKEYGYVALNIKDYNKCLDSIERKPRPAIDKMLNEIIVPSTTTTTTTTAVLTMPKHFATINCFVQILLIRIINTSPALNEDRIDVQQIIDALFGNDNASQIGWNAFKRRRRSCHRSSTTTTTTSPAFANDSRTLIPVYGETNNGRRRIYGREDLSRDTAILNDVVDLKSRIRWIFERPKDSGDGTDFVKRIVYSIGEQFSKLFTGYDKTATAASGVEENVDAAATVVVDDDDDSEFEYRAKTDEKNQSATAATTTTMPNASGNKRRKAQILYKKIDSLVAAALIRKNFLRLVKYFEDDAKIESIRAHAKRNVVRLPFRLKLAAFLVSVHLYKRSPEWKLTDVPIYKQMLSSVAATDDDDDVVLVPGKFLTTIVDARYDVFRWLWSLADEYIPHDFFTGTQNEYRDAMLKDYVLRHGDRYPRAHRLLSNDGNREDQIKFDNVLIALTYLFYMSSFDAETLVMMLKLILSIEFPGQWLKFCVVLQGHRHAGKSKLLDILTEYSKSSASFREPSDSNKENQPGLSLYISNMMLIQDEIATLSNNFKKIISESKIDFRNNMGNVFASIYALSKLWYTCNSLPPCPYDAAVIDRILHVKMEFWHDEITDSQTAQFRYFTQSERGRIYEHLRETVDEKIKGAERSLPFVFHQKDSKLYTASTINETAIKAGLYYISMFFSWFQFVKDIHKPVDIDVKNLPTLPNAWRQDWLVDTNKYFQWKRKVKISPHDGSGCKVPAEFIVDSLKRCGGKDYNTYTQLINTFNDEYGRYFNKSDNTYSVSIDMNELVS